MADEHLACASATALVTPMATKEFSPVELTELHFRRIGRLDSQLDSFLLLTHDEAMKTARDAVVRGDESGAPHDPRQRRAALLTV